MTLGTCLPQLDCIGPESPGNSESGFLDYSYHWDCKLACMWVVGTELRSSFLSPKHFTLWAIVLVWWFPFGDCKVQCALITLTSCQRSSTLVFKINTKLQAYFFFFFLKNFPWVFSHSFSSVDFLTSGGTECLPIVLGILSISHHHSPGINGVLGWIKGYRPCFGKENSSTKGK